MGIGRKFDDPFLLPSSGAMPETLETALDMCLFLYYLNPQYIQASARVVRHFITDFDYPGDDGSKQEQDDLDDYLKHQLQLPAFMNEMGDEWAAYGNGFARIHFPFDRFLVDDRTHTKYALEFFGRQARYDFRSMTYIVPDPKHPGSHINLPFRDQRSKDPSRIRLRRLNPRFLTIQHNIISGSSGYIYRFDPEFVSDVKKGRLYVVNETPIPMLKAIKNNRDFLFDNDAIFHMKAPTVSGISNAGWGMPSTIANFRNLHQLQVYRKIDEAVGLDYMLPFRLFSPNPQQAGGNGGMDSLINSRWTSEIRKIIGNRRRDKFAMHSLPFPVNYQEFGAEGKTLTSKDMMEYQTSAMLDGMGYPQELFKGSLTWMQVPTAMRLFENSFMFLHLGFNSMAGWATRKIRAYLNQPQMQILLQKPSMADSLERKQLVFQLGAMGEVSRETAYSSLGIDDPVAEMKKRLTEDLAIQRNQMKMQTDFQKEVETGSLTAPEQSPGGGGGSAPGMASSGTVTPSDADSQADSLATYWLSIPTNGERTQAMNAVRGQNESLYAVAKEKMNQKRSQGASQGRAQVGQEAQQQQGSQ